MRGVKKRHLPIKTTGLVGARRPDASSERCLPAPGLLCDGIMQDLGPNRRARSIVASAAVDRAQLLCKRPNRNSVARGRDGCAGLGALQGLAHRFGAGLEVLGIAKRAHLGDVQALQLMLDVAA